METRRINRVATNQNPHPLQNRFFLHANLTRKNHPSSFLTQPCRHQLATPQAPQLQKNIYFMRGSFSSPAIQFQKPVFADFSRRTVRTIVQKSAKIQPNLAKNIQIVHKTYADLLRCSDVQNCSEAVHPMIRLTTPGARSTPICLSSARSKARSPLPSPASTC